MTDAEQQRDEVQPKREDTPDDLQPREDESASLKGGFDPEHKNWYESRPKS